MKSTLSGILLLILLSFSAGAEDLERGGEAGIGKWGEKKRKNIIIIQVGKRGMMILRFRKE